MLILGGLGENWTYPNEILDNDVQGEGRGLYQRNMVVCAMSQSLCVGRTNWVPHYSLQSIGYDKGVETFFIEVLAPRWNKRTDITLFDVEADNEDLIDMLFGAFHITSRLIWSNL